MNRQPPKNLQPAATWTEHPRFVRIGALLVLLLIFGVGCQRGGLPEAKNQ